MKKLAIFAGAGLVALGTIGTAAAQSAPASGTPNSPFPYAASHEIHTVNGMPCRTVYDYQSKTRIPVNCAAPMMSGMAAPMPMGGPDVVTTGSIAPVAPVPVAPVMGSVSGTPTSPFPYAAAHEIQTVNGVPCRTVYDYQSKTRIPVACAQ